ncbi:MAG: alginate export family protein [Bryobacteraceae bacterium]|nr:alginate export family protein [Bryobacterales bacterium]MEB2361619.1 alginate export family protein [Bryobacterales bacterium]NUN01034.1 alginate export family protein [Bryobacteraceae bacterium]
MASLHFFRRNHPKAAVSRLLIGMIAAAAAVMGQTAPSVKIGPVAVSGTWRTRIEAWDWFNGAANDTYLYVGSLGRLSFAQQRKTFDWQLEVALPVLLGLPDDALAPGAQGQLGLGATYYVANGRSRNAALPFVKQAFVRFKNVAGSQAQTLRLGRIEFIEGAETVPKNATLAAVKRDRVAHRLLGNFGWSHVGRSLDAVHYAYNGSRNNVTLVAARPTRGVFQVDGWGGLNIGLFYGALTRQVPMGRSAGEFRVFGLHYEDWRHVVKTDNRPLAMRNGDFENIGVTTAGGNYIHAFETGSGTIDLMLWGVLQTGRWGRLDHRAAAATAEAGYQSPGLPRLRPWIRGGVHHGSGDGDPTDGKHGTFFQVLPTPRWYARFPFYNLMNNQDAYLQLILRPGTKLNLRSEMHWLRLARRNDLWYQGGGAFQPWTFGYIGRASSGQRGMAALWELSADYQWNSHFQLGGFFATARGRDVMNAIYPDGKNANLGCIELGFRF